MNYCLIALSTRKTKFYPWADNIKPFKLRYLSYPNWDNLRRPKEVHSDNQKPQMWVSFVHTTAKWIYLASHFLIQVVIRLETKWKYLVHVIKLNLIGALFNYVRAGSARAWYWENDGSGEALKSVLTC